MVDPVYIEPEVSLDVWAIVLHRDGHFHFTGIREAREKGRISSMIESFDLETMTGKTVSGRRYVQSGARNDVLGLSLAAVIWGHENSWGSVCVSPENLALALAAPANGMRC